jgi:hypothetical protein
MEAATMKVMKPGRAIRLFLCAFCLWGLGAGSVAAQEEDAATPVEEDPPSRVETARVVVPAAREIVDRATNADAEKAMAAAENAVKAANGATTAAAKANEVSNDEMATQMVAATTADTAAGAAREAATAAGSAAAAAAQAAGTIDADPAKSRAAQAAAAAQRATTAAATAAGAAEKAAMAAAGTTDAAEARMAAGTAAIETGKAAAAAGTAASETATAAVEATAPSLPVTTPRDENVLAALRARITGGAIFFNGPARITPTNEEGTLAELRSSQFGQAAIYLAFEAQPRVWSGPCNEACQAGTNQTIRDRGYHRVYVDPFVNVRLTTIPVASASAQPSLLIQAPTAAQLQSQKAAQVQIGGTLGVNFGGFDVRGARFHWGIGPAYRVMFQSVTDSQRSLRVWNLDDDLYLQHSGGVRLTLFESDQEVGNSARSGWSPAAYLDVSYGQFQNFETAEGITPEAKTCLENPAECLARKGGPPPEKDFLRKKNARLYVEGRVFLQYLYLGFDLNNGSGLDDLRFMGGLTLKLDQFFARR